MKKILSLLAVILFAAIGAYSQSPAPGIFNYQGVARNSVGNVLINQAIALRLTIHDGTAAGPVGYQETRGVTTNPFGLFNAQVGSAGATNITGTIAGVPWGVADKYIQVEIDPAGGSTFINIGTARIASVPYALYSSLSNDLVLPFNKTQADAGTLFRINNSGTGISGAIMGTTLSPAANAWGVHGQVNNLSAGGFSAGVLGTNLSTTGNGIGVMGTQNGGGWGVYGTAPSGIGVNGASTSGNGVNGSSVTGAAGRFTTTGAGQALFTTGALRFQGIGEGAPIPPTTFKLLAGDPLGNASWQHASAIGLVTGSGTLNFVPKWTPNGTTLGNSKIFDDGTFVGIGTTTPGAGLVVAGNGIWNSAIGITNTVSGMEWRMNVNGTTFGITKIPGATFTPFTLLSDGQVEFPSTAGADRLRILDNGNVGVGITTPTHKLEVQGIERINATTVQEGGELRFQEGSLFGAPNHWIIDNFESFAGGNKFRVWNDAGSMALQMMPTGRVAVGNMVFSDQPQSTLDVEGNLAVGTTYSGTTAAPVNGAIIEGTVGIGTNAPLGKFNVASGSAFLNTNLQGSSNAGTWLSLGNTDPGGRWFNIVNTASGNGEGPGKLIFFQGGAANLTTGSIMTLVHSNLNVGINTNNPLYKFHVNSGNSFATQILEGLNPTNAGPHLQFLSGAESSFIDYIRTDYTVAGFAHRQGSLELRGGNRLNFYPNAGLVGSADLAMTVIGNGHVGIGKVTPTSRLDVLNSTPSDRAATIALTDATNINQAVVISTARNIIESSFVATALTTVKGPGAGYGSSGPATIYSTSRDAHGVVGSSDNGIGVFGIGINGAAMQATSVGTAPGLNVFAIGGGTGINVFHNQPTGLGVSIQKFDPSNLNPALDVFNAGNGTAGNFLSTTGKAIFGQTNGTTFGLFAIHGLISSSSPGGASTALRGENNGTGGLGVGVWGSQNGSGWGVFGTTPSGLGVYGSTNSGIGVYGDANTGWGMRAISNTNTAIFATSNTGFGGDFRSQTNYAGLFQTTDLTNNVPSIITLNPSQQLFARALYAQGSGYSGYYWATRQVAEVQSDSTVGIGLVSRYSTGVLSASETGNALQGFIFNTTGFGNAAVLGQSTNPNSHGLYGVAPNGGIGRALATNGPLQLTGIGEANNYVLASDAVGNANWKPLSAIGGVSGSGTVNFVPKWTPSGVFLGNSQIFDNGFAVGIGTSTPGFKLHIADNFPEVLVQDIDDATSISLIPRGLGYTGGVGTRGNNDLPLFTNNTDRVTIKATTGYVGIGNTVPTNRLEVIETGTTRAGLFQVNNPASFATALEVNSNAAGLGIHAQSNTPGFCNCGVIDGLTTVVGANAVYGRGAGANTWGVYGLSNNSAGVAGIGWLAGSVGVYGQGWLGSGGQFFIDNTFAGNTSNALEVSNTQTGKAANFVINNVANTSDVIFATTNSTSTTPASVHGQNGSSGIPLFAKKGVWGESDNGVGVYGSSSSSVGVYGYSNTGFAGVQGSGTGVSGVYASNFSTGYGLYATSLSGTAGRFDNTTTGNVNHTVYVTTNGFGNAIRAFSDKSTSIVGWVGVNSGYGSAGVFGINNSVGGNGLYGTGNRFDDWGLLAHSDSSIGVYSDSYYDRAGYFTNFGLNNTTANTVEIINAGMGHGVYAQTASYNQLSNFYNPASAFKAAGYFRGNAGTGVIGYAPGTFTHTGGGRIGVGVYGVADSSGANYNYGVVGVGRGSVGENAGVVGYVDGSSGGTFNAAIYGVAFPGPAPRYAGYFDGNVQVIGNFAATGAKAFKIDHPLDPANKYLSHFAIESPEVQNIYNGNVVTDANGKAVVNLPDYFSSINKDFKYQLTIVDETQFAMARISKKINGNSFELMTSVPNVEVSWQVTAVRNDKAAQKFVEPAETMKLAGERGKYLNPELYGQGAEKSIAGMKGGLNLPGQGEISKNTNSVSQPTEKMLNLQKQALTGNTNVQKQKDTDKVIVPDQLKVVVTKDNNETQAKIMSPDVNTQKGSILASSLKPVEEIEFKKPVEMKATLSEADALKALQKNADIKVQTQQQAQTAEVNNNAGKLLPPNMPAGAGLFKGNNSPKLPADENKSLQDPEKSQGSMDKLKEATNQDNKQIKTPVMPDTKQAGMEKAPVQKQETKQQTQSQKSPELQIPVQPVQSKQVSNDASKDKTKTD